MFTLPDANDAAPTCPPIGGPGPIPGGFFADCNPMENFEGTKPVAAIFNELILNLHALLKWANVAPNKGDETMLWRCLLQAIQTNVPPIIYNLVPDIIYQLVPPMIPPERVITWYQVINVATYGVPSPANPMAGQPFDSLFNALAWLGWYRINATGFVLINIGPGVFGSNFTVELYHPDGNRVAVQGAGSGATALYFPPGINGLHISGNINRLQGLQVQSNAGGAVGGTGIVVEGDVVMSDVLVQNFGDAGINVIDYGAVTISGYVTCNGCWHAGFQVFMGGQVMGDNLILNGNGRNGEFWAANLVGTTGGIIWLNYVATTGGVQGIRLSGTAVEMRAARIWVDHCSNPAAVEVNDGAMLIATGGNPGDWSTWNTAANSPQWFNTNVMGLIRADNLFSAANRANASPAINTQGNLYSFIYAS